MSTVPKGIGKGEGGAGVAKLETLLNELIDDLTAIRAGLIATNAQLDLDAGVTDTDYAANNDPAALKSIKSA